MRLMFLALIASASIADAADKPNVLIICVDDLRPELPCFGKGYVHAPNIDQLAASGRVFHRHYVQAPTCGASRYALLTGRYGPSGNDALFARGKSLQQNPDSYPPSLPAWFRKNGYTTVSVGKVSHHPGGRGGKDWNDEKQPEMPYSWDRHLLPAGQWQHPRGSMHGLAHGEIRASAKDMDLFQSVDGSDDIYPDGLITNEALAQLDALASGSDPFFLAFGIIRPHLPFGAPEKYMKPYVDATLPEIAHPSKPSGKTTWHGSGEFMKYNRWKRNPNEDSKFATEVRKHYAACITYADALVGRVLSRLAELEQDQNTIVVLWGDHGWHLGEHAIWGKHSLFEESLHSPLIIRYPDMKHTGTPVKAMVETIDIFPTLCELADLPMPGFIQGVSLEPMLASLAPGGGHPAIGYFRSGDTIRTDTHRLILQKDGDIELYDHRTPQAETKNIASANPELVDKLSTLLKSRLGK